MCGAELCPVLLLIYLMLMFWFHFCDLTFVFVGLFICLVTVMGFTFNLVRCCVVVRRRTIYIRNPFNELLCNKAVFTAMSVKWKQCYQGFNKLFLFVIRRRDCIRDVVSYIWVLTKFNFLIASLKPFDDLLCSAFHCIIKFKHFNAVRKTHIKT